MTKERTPDFLQALDEAIDARILDVWTALPARVVAYAAAAGTVDVQPIPADYFNGEPVAIPVLAGVPVAWSAGAGARVVFPIAVGDVVIVVFAARALDRWRGSGAEDDPQSVRHHSLADAWALPVAGWTLAGHAANLQMAPPTGGKIELAPGAGQRPVARRDDPIAASPTGAWGAWLAAVGVATGAGAPPGTAWTGTITAGSPTVEAG